MMKLIFLVLFAITANAQTIYFSGGSSSGAGAWGDITGTLADQTDLQSALDLKAPLASPTFSGTVALPATTSVTFNGTALSTTLGLKANLAGPSFTGTVGVAGTLSLAFGSSIIMGTGGDYKINSDAISFKSNNDTQFLMRIGTGDINMRKHLIFQDVDGGGGDNSLDVGSANGGSSYSRPRHVYVGTSINIGLSSGSTNSAAILQTDSTTKGWLPARGTTTNRDNIASGTPPEALIFYDTTEHKLSYYNGTAWKYVAVE